MCGRSGSDLQDQVTCRPCAARTAACFLEATQTPEPVRKGACASISWRRQPDHADAPASGPQGECRRIVL